MRRLSLTIVLVALLAAGCTGDPDETEAPTTTAPAGDPDDVLVPIDPVSPTTTTSSTTTTTLVERSYPTPDWEPVGIPVGPEVRPTALTKIVEEPANPGYDLAPDGRHISVVQAGELCIISTSDQAATCTADGGPEFVVWSPDSSRVLFGGSSWITGLSGPLSTFSVDGDVEVLFDTTNAGSTLGGAIDAGFVDAATVVYTRVVGTEEWAYEVHHVAVDGGQDELVGAFELGAPGGGMIPWVVAFGDGGVYFEPTISPQVSGLGAGIWRFEPATDSIGPIQPSDGRLPAGVVGADVPVAVRAGVMLSADGFRLPSYSSNQDSARFFTLATIDGRTIVTIDDLDDEYMIVSAALSPDGAHLAAFELYRGDDRSVSDSSANGRVSITSTVSLFTNTPSWSTITDVGPGAPSLDLDGAFTTIVWPTPDRVYVELLDSAWAIDVTAT